MTSFANRNAEEVRKGTVPARVSALDLLSTSLSKWWRVMVNSTGGLALRDEIAEVDRLTIDVAGGVTIPGALSVTGTVAGSNLTNLAKTNVSNTFVPSQTFNASVTFDAQVGFGAGVVALVRNESGKVGFSTTAEAGGFTMFTYKSFQMPTLTTPSITLSGSSTLGGAPFVDEITTKGFRYAWVASAYGHTLAHSTYTLS